MENENKNLEQEINEMEQVEEGMANQVKVLKMEL